MRPAPDIRYDVASALSQGQRDYQEDAIITDFPLGAEVGFAVLADGMGGHAAGDVASKIVVTEVFSELKLQTGDQKTFESAISDILLDAALAANECVNGHVNANPGTEGMGATLVAPVFIRNQLFWISIGDSPLFLYRNGILQRLNEDHSMAPQIDLMVSSGMIEADVGENHPDRNCLTSVLIGGEIPRIDCPKTPVALRDGDVLIVASDGLQFLSDHEIEQVLASSADKTSHEISVTLLRALEVLADPDQDNISFSVVKVAHVARPAKRVDVRVLKDAQPDPAFSTARNNGGIAASVRQPAARTMNMFLDIPDATDGAI